SSLLANAPSEDWKRGIMSPEMTIGKSPSRTGFQVPFKGVVL
ncbi:unnamed protein product, partial [marine sediment metagenome]